jgi:SAM-dependent methyltransferase
VNAESLYDEYWQTNAARPEWDEATFNRYLSPLKGLGRVLDYGCGVGCFYQRHLARSAGEYVGADVSDLAIARTRAKGYSALKIDPGTGRIDAADGSFDGACCLEVFEHLFDPLQAAREIHRSLKPGGILVATVPNFGYHAWRLLAFLRAQVPLEPRTNRYDGVHIRFFSKLMLKRMLRDAGFESTRIGSYDTSSVWDAFSAMGKPIAWTTSFAHRHVPAFLHLSFLQDVWPNVFAKRLRAVARKPGGQL